MKGSDIPRGEMLRYLGHRGQEIDGELSARLERAAQECAQLARPRGVWRSFGVKRGGGGFALTGTQVVLRGGAMEELLEGAYEAALLCGTLGSEIDRALITYSQREVSYALLLDAAASTAIEVVMDDLQREVADYAAQKGALSSARFSPGYGDLSLDVQQALLTALDASRRAGVSTTGNLLLPRKSVTAIVAIGDVMGKRQGCSACTGDCAYPSCPRHG